MTSIFENTSSNITIHILHDYTLTEDNRRNFILTAEKYSQGLEFVDVSAYAEKLGAEIQENSKRWTIGTMFRLFIPEVLPELDKVIYLDCDIIVNMDILNLWNVDIADNCIAGAVEQGLAGYSNFSLFAVRCRLNGCRMSTYINAGVTVMNLKAIRGRFNLSAFGREWLIRHLPTVKYTDQDALNGIFYGSIKIIDPCFNRRSRISEDDLSGNIIHAHAWHSFGAYPALEKIYWKCYLKTAWGEHTSSVDLVDELNDIAHLNLSSPYFHKHFTSCIKRLLNIVRIRLMYLYEPVKILIFVSRNACYQLKYKLSHKRA